MRPAFPLFILFFVLHTPSPAQSIPMPNPTGWVSLPLQQTLMSNLLHNATRGSSQPVSSGATSSSARANASNPAVPPLTILRFAEDPAVTKRVEQDTIEDLRQRKGNQLAQGLQQFLSRRDFRSDWLRMVAADGLQRNDLIDVIAAEWVLSWVMANHGDNTRAQTLGTRTQVAQAISHDPALLRLTDRQRQVFGETLMLHQVVVGSAYVQALHAGNRSAMNVLGENARRDFQNAFGMDLTAYTLTSAGLRLGR